MPLVMLTGLPERDRPRRALKARREAMSLQGSGRYEQQLYESFRPTSLSPNEYYIPASELGDMLALVPMRSSAYVLPQGSRRRETSDFESFIFHLFVLFSYERARIRQLHRSRAHHLSQ